MRIELEGKFLTEYDILLKDFVGRQAELKKLKDFVRKTKHQRSFRSIARPFSPGRRRLLFSRLSQCTPGDFGLTETLQMRRDHHRFDYS